MLQEAMTIYEERGLTFERRLVKAIADEVEKRGMSQRAFALKVFGENDTSASRWSRVRDPKNKGKPRMLKMHEAYAAAAVLGTDLSHLVFKAEQSLESI